MKHFFTFFMIACGFLFCGNLFSQVKEAYHLRFGDGISSDESRMVIARITAFRDLLKSGDHFGLSQLWSDSREHVEFDGNYTISCSSLDYLNNDSGIPRKYGKGDVSIIVSHWAGKDFDKYGPNASQNYVTLCLLDYEKIGSYFEFGKIVDESFGATFSEGSGLSEIFQLSKKGLDHNMPCKEMSIEWDNDGKIIAKSETMLVNQISNLPVITTSAGNKTEWGRVLQIPKNLKDKNLQLFFNRMTSILSTQKLNDIITLLELPLINRSDYKLFQVSFCEWKCRWGYVIGNRNNELYGYGFARDISGQPQLYIEGSIELPRVFNSTPLLSGKGIEIKFHPTGYPASYKAIVKNRLFGRQIEWNDQGEVISDVDLDIPMPWSDAPKNDDSN